MLLYIAFKVQESFLNQLVDPTQGDAGTVVGPGCTLCKTNARVTPVAPQLYNKVEGWHTPEVQRSKNLASRFALYYASTPMVIV